jgi:hypothetical protein
MDCPAIPSPGGRIPSAILANSSEPSSGTNLGMIGDIGWGALEPPMRGGDGPPASRHDSFDANAHGRK